MSSVINERNIAIFISISCFDALDLRFFELSTLVHVFCLLYKFLMCISKQKKYQLCLHLLKQNSVICWISFFRCLFWLPIKWQDNIKSNLRNKSVTVCIFSIFIKLITNEIFLYMNKDIRGMKNTVRPGSN